MNTIMKVRINSMFNRKIFLAAITAATLAMTGCGASNVSDTLQTSADSIVSSFDKESESAAPEDNAAGEESTATGSGTAKETLSSNTVSASSGSLIDTTDMFTDRDLEQSPDLGDATYITLESGKDVNITSEGTYVISGTATDVSIIVEAADTDKVQLVLDGADITNSTSPAIYVKSADKVFVTATGDNSLSVTGTFTADGTTNTDAVIYSKDDLVLNGTGSLTISSTSNGISCKDDLKVTGGTFKITSTDDAVEANDSISIYAGSFDIDSQKDGFHSENSDDDSAGYIYIKDGTFNIEAEEDGIQATTVLMIDGGTFDITGSEGLEATYVQINGGTISISASDDGINATQKSSSYDVVIEVNGGDITVVMGSGDTDGFDANGSIYINGGTINVTGNSAFDYDKTAELNGGTVIINGEEVTEIPQSMMGGPGMGGHGGFGGGFGGDGQMPEGFDPANGEMPEGFDPASGERPAMPDGTMPQEGAATGQGGKMRGGRGGKMQNGAAGQTTQGSGTSADQTTTDGN
jgi:hypothetical protein